MDEAVETYVRRGRRFLAQASLELADGDLEQASEKGWGAAAQIMKAIAEQRGWRHGQHRQLFEVARRLAEEQDDPRIVRLFRRASDLHVNFYEGRLSTEEIRTGLLRVSTLVEKVQQVLEGDA